MAEIEKGDLVSSEALKEPHQLAREFDLATEALQRLINTGKEAGVSIKSATSTKQLGDETKKLTIAQNELLKIEKQIEVANARANKVYQDRAKALANLKKEQRDSAVLGEREAKAINEQNASLKQLEVALQKNRAAYKELANEEARNTKEGKELKAIIDQQDAAVKKLNGGIGDFTDNVGDYRGALKGLKDELKLARDEMAKLASTSGTTSKEFVKAAERAGEIKDQINDLNDAIKNTSASKFENLGNSLKDVGSKLLNLDFGGAEQSAKQFAATAKSMTFKEVTEGLKSFGNTLATVGKAILTNPLFILAGVIAGVVLAFQYFREQQEKASKAAIERYKRELDALTARYDTEIKLQQIVGKQTFELEKAKQRLIIDNAKKSIKALGDVTQINLLNSILEKRIVTEVNDEKVKQLNEYTNAVRDANNEIRIIEAEQAEFERKTAADLAKQRSDDLFELNKFRLQIQLEAQEEILDNEKKSYNDRQKAAVEARKIRDNIARLEYENAIKQEKLTAEAILLINLQLQDALNKNRKEQGDKYKELLDEQNKAIQDKVQDNLAKARNAVSKSVEAGFKPIEDQKKAAEELIGDLGDNVADATASAAFNFRKLFSSISEQLTKTRDQFSTWAGAISDLFSSVTQRRIAGLDEESRANEEKLTQDLILAGDNEAAKERLQLEAAKKEQELEKRRRAEARKAAILDKAISLATAIINTALAVTNQLKGGDPYTAFARATLAGILGGIQVAAIAAKPIPAYQFGTKSKPTDGPAIVGEVGSELMIKPGGGMELTPSVATVMDIPRGTEIIPHDKTMRMLAMGALTSVGGSKVVSYDPELLNEIKQLNHNVKNIKQPKQPSLIRSGGTIYEALEEKKGQIKLRRSINLGKFLE